MAKLILLITILLYSCECKDIYYNAKIHSHSVTSDKHGNTTYRTVLIREDGFIVEKIGLKYYILKEGTYTKIKTVKCQ